MARFSTKTWEPNLCFSFFYKLVWNISHYKKKLEERSLTECINSSLNKSFKFIRS
jgi:hypothetical protein